MCMIPRRDLCLQSVPTLIVRATLTALARAAALQTATNAPLAHQYARMGNGQAVAAVPRKARAKHVPTRVARTVNSVQGFAQAS